MPYLILSVIYEPIRVHMEFESTVEFELSGFSPEEKEIWNNHFIRVITYERGLLMGERTKEVPERLNYLENLGYEVVSSTASHQVDIIDGTSDMTYAKDLYTWTLRKKREAELNGKPRMHLGELAAAAMP